MKRRWQKPDQPVSKYVVPDPIPVRLREAFFKYLWCRVFGHDEIVKFSGTKLCRRHR